VYFIFLFHWGFEFREGWKLLIVLLIDKVLLMSLEVTHILLL